MKQSKLRNAILVCTAIASISALPAQKAHAFATSGDIAALKVATEQAIKSAVGNITKSYTQGTDTIQDALLDFSTQMSANNANDMKLQANMKDVEDQRQTQMKVEDARYNAQKAATSGASLCNNITGAAATQNLDHLLAIYRAGAVATMNSWDSGHLPGKKSMTSAGTLTDLYDTDHCAKSATQLDYQIGRCHKSPTSTPTQKGTVASMDSSDGMITTADDQNPDLILNGTDLTKEQQASMKNFMILASDSMPIGQPDVASMAESEDRKQLLMQVDSLHLQKNLVHSIVGGLVGENSIIDSKDNGTQAKAVAWAEATAAKTAGYTQKCVDGKCGYFPNGLSVHDTIELEAKYWYYNLTYGIFASAEGQAPSQKDLNEMMAYNIVLNYRKYQLLREMDFSLAEILSIMVEQRQQKVLSHG